MSSKTQLRAAAFMFAISIFAPFATAAKVTRPILKEFFQTGDIPSSQDFKNFIDSSLNLNDDGLTSYRVGVDSSGHALRLEAGASVDASITFAPASDNPALAPNWLGLFGFLPLELQHTTTLATHYGFLQMEMASGPLTPSSGPGPAISVQYVVYESLADTALTTFTTVPELTSAIIWCAGAGTLTLFRRRRLR